MSLIGFAPVNIAVKEKWMWTLIIWIYLIISVYKLLYDRTYYLLLKLIGQSLKFEL